VPPDAITSPEYQVWRIKDGLIPGFVEVLIHLPFLLILLVITASAQLKNVSL
jgi:hypothetical protein